MLITPPPSPFTFYCPNCKLRYGLSPAELAEHGGVAHCPFCDHHRTDGFNQHEPHLVSCIKCGARIGIAPHQTFHCPNAHLPDHG